MAAKFPKGTVVELQVAVPCGPVQDFRMDGDGNIWYLVEWTDSEGAVQQRWFEEAVLAAKG